MKKRKPEKNARSKRNPITNDFLSSIKNAALPTKKKKWVKKRERAEHERLQGCADDEEKKQQQQQQRYRNVSQKSMQLTAFGKLI